MPKPSRRSSKEALMKRLEGDYNRKKGGGSLFRSDVKGVTFWQCKEGDHIIDILPYTAGENDPIEPGSESYVLEFFVHNNVGQQEGGQIICMAETFKKPCPICEERRRLIKIGSDEQRIKELTPSRYPRSIYNIICYDSRDEEEKGVQVWHTSNYLLQQYLLALAKKPTRAGQKSVDPFIAFMDVEEGKSIAFKREGKKESTKYIGIRFEDRNYTIPEDLVESAHVLDDLINWPTYEEVYQAFWGSAPNEAGAPADLLATTTRARKYDDTPAKEKEEPPPARSIRHEESVKEEAPRASRRQQRVEDEDTTAGKSSNKCPAGKNFGIDIDELKECEKCNVWKDCAKEADAIEKAKKK